MHSHLVNLKLYLLNNGALLVGVIVLQNSFINECRILGNTDFLFFICPHLFSPAHSIKDNSDVIELRLRIAPPLISIMELTQGY